MLFHIFSQNIRIKKNFFFCFNFQYFFNSVAPHFALTNRWQHSPVCFHRHQFRILFKYNTGHFIARFSNIFKIKFVFSKATSECEIVCRRAVSSLQWKLKKKVKRTFYMAFYIFSFLWQYFNALSTADTASSHFLHILRCCFSCCL